MAFSFNEFPNTNFYDSDLRELIAMYKKLSEAYDEIVAEFTEVKEVVAACNADVADVKVRMTTMETTIANVKAQMDVLEENILRAVNNTVDTKLSALEKTVYQSITSMETKVDKQLSDLMVEVTSISSQLRTEMADIRTLIETNLIESKRYTDGKSNLLEIKIANNYNENIRYTDAIYNNAVEYTDIEIDKVEEQIKEIKTDQTSVVDPTDEVFKPTQEAINNMFYNLKCWALRAIAQHRYAITADEYDGLEITAWEYDFMGKWYCKERFQVRDWVLEKVNDVLDGFDTIVTEVNTKVQQLNRRMDDELQAYSPLSGLTVKLRDLCYEMVAIIRTQALTADEYDTLGITADDFDNNSYLNAYIYDWFGKMIFFNQEYVFTAEEYDAKEIIAVTYDVFGLTAIEYDTNGKLLLARA